MRSRLARVGRPLGARLQRALQGTRLPAAAPRIQQRTLFDEVVKPLTQEPGTTAFFVVDALRFEMGEELFRELEGTPATTALLRPRLAELPTVTEVGMNVLAPVARTAACNLDGGRRGRGRARASQTGEFRVSDPETRRRAMHDRVGGATCPLAHPRRGRQPRQSPRSSARSPRRGWSSCTATEIDKAGEKGVGPAVFDQVLQKLRAAWRLLRDAGVRRFVFTATTGSCCSTMAPHRPAAWPPGRPEAQACLLAGGGGPRGRGQGRARGPRLRGRERQLMFPETHGGLRHRPAGDGLRARRQQPAGAGHPGAHRWCTGRRPAGAAPATASRRRRSEGVAGMHCVEAKVEHHRAARRWICGVPEGHRARTARARAAEDVQVELVPDARQGADRGRRTIVATVGEPLRALLPPLRHRPTRVRSSRSTTEGRGGRRAVRAGRALRCHRSARYTRAGSPCVRRSKRVETGCEQLPEGGVRQVFEHLAAHGAVTEDEAAAMLGGPRGAAALREPVRGICRRRPPSACGSTSWPG